MSSIRLAMMSPVAALAALALLVLAAASSSSLVAVAAQSTPAIVLPPMQPAAVSGAFIHAKYGSGKTVDEIRRYIPRWGGQAEFSADREYATGVVYQVAPGAALLIITLLIWIVWMFASCCCSKPDPKGYTRAQRVVPMVFAFVFSLVVVAFCVVGILNTEKFDQDISGGNNGMTVIASSMLTHVNEKFTVLNNNITAISTQINLLAPSVATAIGGFTPLGRGLPGLIADLQRYSVQVGGYNPVNATQVDPANSAGSSASYPYTGVSPAVIGVPCLYCPILQDLVSQVVVGLSGSPSQVFGQIDTLKTNAIQQVVNEVPNIQRQIATAVSSISDVQTQSANYQLKVDDFKGQVNDYEKYRRIAVLCIFAFPCFLVLLMWIFSLGLKGEGCTKFIVHLLFFAGIIIWLIFLIHLPFSVVIADSCHYVDGVEVDLQAKTSLDSTITQPLTACLSSQNLIVGLNMSRQLDFTSSVVFPVIPSIDAVLNNTVLFQLNQLVQSINISTFPYDPSQKWRDLATLNSQTTTQYTFGTLASATPATFELTNTNNTAPVFALRVARNVILTSLVVETNLNATIAATQYNMSMVLAEYNLLLNLTTKLLYTDVPSLKLLLNPILDAANNVIYNAYCDPLNEDYLQLKTTFCDKMIVSVSQMALASFIIGVFLFFLNVSCWYMIHRLQHREGEAMNGKFNPTVTNMYSVDPATGVMQQMAPMEPVPQEGSSPAAYVQQLGVSSPDAESDRVMQQTVEMQPPSARGEQKESHF